MTTIRIGNDIFVVWKVFSRNGVRFSLENQNIRIWLSSGPFKMEITDFTTSIRGEVAFKIDADSITRYGIYKLEMIIYDQDAETADATFDVTNLFQIVSTNYEDTNNPVLDGSVEIEACSILNNTITSTLEGASAYEIAVKHGYTGTEEEWLHDPVNGIMGNGIVKTTIHQSLAQSGVSTIEFKFGTGETKEVSIPNGKGMTSMSQTTTSEESDGVNVVTVNLSDGTAMQFQFKNGARGNSGYTGAAEELEVVNGLDGDDPEGDAAKALSAYQGFVLDGKTKKNKANIDQNEARFEQTRNVFSKYGIVSGVINSSGVVIPSDTYHTSDFLPVEASTTYRPSRDGAPISLDVVAFYNNGEYISRETSAVSVFTTPATCTHIRVSSNRMYVNGVVGNWCISKNGIIPYVPNKHLAGVETDADANVKLLNYVSFGMSKFVDKADLNSIIINASNMWLQLPGAASFLLPVKEGQVVKLTNGGPVASIYAFLKDDHANRNTAPDFVYQYNQIVNETDGSITWEVVTDEHDNPVLDTRHTVLVGTSVVETIPPETKFLYITAITPLNNVPMKSLPVYISIDDVVYNNETSGRGASSGEYETIFFDDFNGALDSSIWTRHTDTPTSGGRYKSRFKTDQNNAYTDQGCLVLKCSKTATEADGTYLDHGGAARPVEYIAPYISTADSFCCKEGKISARIKCSKGVEDGIFPFCFWTFGQNNAWPVAHEMDIAESSASISSTDKTTSDGTLLPAGSHCSAFATHTHVHSQDVNDVFKEKLIWINWTLYEEGEPTGDAYDYIKKANLSEWHVYSVEWNKDSIVYSIDGRALISYSAEELGAIDAEGNIGLVYPQDIRFNLKAAEASVDQDCYVYVDWVKAEAKDMTPCSSIEHDDVELATDAGIFVQPTFNTGCSNQAFTIDIGQTGLYTGVINPEAGSLDPPMVVHPNDGEIAAQEKTIYMMSNGDLYVLDDDLLKKCDMNGNILSAGGEPLTDYIFGYRLDNGVISYRKYNSTAAAQVMHRIVGTHAGTTEVNLLSANKRTGCSFTISVE